MITKFNTYLIQEKSDFNQFNLSQSFIQYLHNNSNIEILDKLKKVEKLDLDFSYFEKNYTTINSILDYIKEKDDAVLVINRKENLYYLFLNQYGIYKYNNDPGSLIKYQVFFTEYNDKDNKITNRRLGVQYNKHVIYTLKINEENFTNFEFYKLKIDAVIDRESSKKIELVGELFEYYKITIQPLISKYLDKLKNNIEKEIIYYKDNYNQKYDKHMLKLADDLVSINNISKNNFYFSNLNTYLSAFLGNISDQNNSLYKVLKTKDIWNENNKKLLLSYKDIIVNYIGKDIIKDINEELYYTRQLRYDKELDKDATKYKDIKKYIQDNIDLLDKYKHLEDSTNFDLI